MPSAWWAYVTRTAGTEATQKDIAEATGIEQSSISRWKLGKNTPHADAVVHFARSYQASPVAALIAAGYLSPDEVEGVVEIAATPISQLTTSEVVGQLRDLFNELQRRVPTVGDIVGDVVDKTENWPKGFRDGVRKQPPPVSGRENS
jgi:transcriptional regulator with XRE-family HTH domain